MSLSQLKAKIENANDISWELGIRNEKNLIHEIDEMAYFQSFFISRVAFYNYKNFSSVNGIPFSIRLSSKKKSNSECCFDWNKWRWKNQSYNCHCERFILARCRYFRRASSRKTFNRERYKLQQKLQYR